MITFFERPITEQDLIRKAYEFEMDNIKELSTKPNPYKKQIIALVDGPQLWEAINFALEMAFD